MVGLLDNAIVLTRDGIMNGELRFPDEFGRHKTLDLIGDLALIGRPLLARVVAHKAGHALHTQLVSRLLADPSLWIETSAHVPQSDSREPEEETYASQEYSPAESLAEPSAPERTHHNPSQAAG